MDAISSTYPTSQTDTAQAVASTGKTRAEAAQPGTAATADTAAARKPDTVHISAKASVESLKQSGQTVAQIASTLGMSTTEVEQELGETTSSSSSLQAKEVAALL